MSNPRKVLARHCCDGEDCPFDGEYRIYDHHNKQVGELWCEGCADEKLLMLNAYHEAQLRMAYGSRGT